MKEKFEVFIHFKKFRATSEKQIHKFLHSNGGNEYLSHELNEYLSHELNENILANGIKQ